MGPSIITCLSLAARKYVRKHFSWPRVLPHFKAGGVRPSPGAAGRGRRPVPGPLEALGCTESKSYAHLVTPAVFDGPALIRVLALREDELFDRELLRVEITIVGEK